MGNRATISPGAVESQADRKITRLFFTQPHLARFQFIAWTAELADHENYALWRRNRRGMTHFNPELFATATERIPGSEEPRLPTNLGEIADMVDLE